MKQTILPKKNSKIAPKKRSYRLGRCIVANSLLNNSAVLISNSVFNFEVITPQMQIQERNSAYSFFSR